MEPDDPTEIAKSSTEGFTRHRPAGPSASRRDEVVELGMRAVHLFDALEGVLADWERLDDTEDVRLRELLDPIGDVLASIVEMVPDYLDDRHHPISQHRLACLRRDL